MDDCNLEQLRVIPGEIVPAFHQNTLVYRTIVPSTVSEVTLDPVTRDSGATYTILGSGKSNKVTVEEGAVTDINVEVCAEDRKTTKVYSIHVKRLSAKDATLSCLKLDKGQLVPEFKVDTYNYTCLLGCDVNTVFVTPTPEDHENAITVDGDKPGSPTPLNVGSTNIVVEVTSKDGSNKEKYCICATRKQLPRHVRITVPGLALQFEDPISFSTLYRPVTIRNSDPKLSFSAPVIDEFAKTVQCCPINNMRLEPDWRVEDFEMDKKMREATACVPLTYGGFSEICKFSDLGAQIAKCNVAPKVEDAKDRYKDINARVNHKVEVRKWEEHLQKFCEETSSKKLVCTAKENLKNYFAALQNYSQKRELADGERPMTFLQQAIYCYARAVKCEPKDAKLHFQLGMLLEEKCYIGDMFGLKKEALDESTCLYLQNTKSSEENKYTALCEHHGVVASAPLQDQLDAIYTVYCKLRSSGQFSEAISVLKLYLWKSKQTFLEGAPVQKAEESPLHQAFLKYMDALACNENNALFNFHVGRMLVVQGKYDNAVKRLETSLNLNVNNQISRFYLGLALAMKKDGPGSRAKEAILYLLEAFETLMIDRTKQAVSPEPESYIERKLRAKNLMQSTNVHLTRGFIELGRLLRQNNEIKEAMSPEDIFRNAALLATQMLPFIARGDTYRQFEWVILDAHANLLEILSASQAGNELIDQRCERLSGLIKHSMLAFTGKATALAVSSAPAVRETPAETTGVNKETPKGFLERIPLIGKYISRIGRNSDKDATGQKDTQRKKDATGQKDTQRKKDVQVLCKSKYADLVKILLQEFHEKLEEFSFKQISGFEEADRQYRLFIVCFTVTRLFEDASVAIQGKPGDCEAALLIFHLREKDSPKLLPSKFLLSDPQFKTVSPIIDFLFTLTPKPSIYDCHENYESYKKVETYSNQTIHRSEESFETGNAAQSESV